MKKPGAPAMAHANNQRINVVPTLFHWTSPASSLATAPGVKFAPVQSTRVGKLEWKVQLARLRWEAAKAVQEALRSAGATVSRFDTDPQSDQS